MNILCLLVFVCFFNLGNGQDISINQWSEFNTSRNFIGKVVLVTESSHGIGRVVNALFARLGAQVVVSGKNAEEIKKTAKEMREISLFGLKPLEVVADVTKTKDAESLVRRTVNKFGKLDVLVTNMYKWDLGGAKHPNFMKVFDNSFKSHLRSAAHLTHLAAPHLAKTNGTIVHISCIVSENPRPFTMAYSAAMHGVDILTNVAAMELGPRVRVNSINSGVMRFDIPHYHTDELNKFFMIRVKSDTPLKRIGEPFDLAKAVVFLASSDAKYITGVNLKVDGGYAFNII